MARKRERMKASDRLTKSSAGVLKSFLSDTPKDQRELEELREIALRDTDKLRAFAKEQGIEGSNAPAWFLWNQMVQNIDRDVIREYFSKEGTKEVTKEPTREATSAVTKEDTGEATSAVTKADTKEVTKESTSEATREPTREATSEATSEATKAVTKESTSGATREPTREATSEATKAVTKADTKEVTKESTSGATREPTREATKAVTKADTGEATSAVTKEDTGGATSEPTKAGTKEVTKEPTSAVTKADTGEATSEDVLARRKVLETFSQIASCYNNTPVKYGEPFTVKTNVFITNRISDHYIPKLRKDSGFSKRDLLNIALELYLKLKEEPESHALISLEFQTPAREQTNPVLASMGLAPKTLRRDTTKAHTFALQKPIWEEAKTNDDETLSAQVEKGLRAIIRAIYPEAKNSL